MSRLAPRGLLAAGLSLVLLPSPHALADPPPRTKSPCPMSISLPADPALLSPEQRLKLALARVPATTIAPPPGAQTLPARRSGVFAAPVEVSAADRAILEARLKAKLEASRGPQRSATAKQNLQEGKPATGHSTILIGPPGLTPAEQAKAADIPASARKEAGR